MADETCQPDIKTWPGDPNGHVQATGPALCQERDPITGEVVRVWIMDEGQTGTVWH